MTRDRTAGLSLLNTLIVVAIGAGLVHGMLSSQDAALKQLEGAQDLAQAKSLALSGVTSAVSALQRDFAEAPETDHVKEPWAQANQTAIELDTGTFTVAIEDARGRFDLNALGPAQLAEQRLFANLLRTLELPEALASQIARVISTKGPLAHPQELLEHGIAAADVKRLAPYVDAFRERGPINVNAADRVILAALLNNERAANGLVSRRQTRGFLDESDFQALGVFLPSLAAFNSNSFDVYVLVEYGGARVETSRRLIRDTQTGAIATTPSK